MAAEPKLEITRLQLRERILDTFAEGARHGGPRSVVMSELASELGISTRTLYQHFSSKAELVGALLERWADEVDAEQAERIRGGRSPYEQMLEAADGWLESQCGFSGAFWVQVERDYPEAAARYQERLRAILDAGRQVLVPYIRDDLDEGLALALMHSSLRTAAEPERCERLGLSQREAVRQAIEVWVRGSLRPVRALHAVPDPEPPGDPAADPLSAGSRDRLG